MSHTIQQVILTDIVLIYHTNEKKFIMSNHKHVYNVQVCISAVLIENNKSSHQT